MTVESQQILEAIGYVEKSKPREKSVDLLKNSIKDGEPGYDKVFVCADSVVQNENKWEINIKSGDPTVVLDKNKEDLKLNVPTVNELRNGNGEKKLISGGVWVWIEDNNGNRFLTLMRRDAGAPADKNCLTGPAGRCGEKLSQTSVDETNQELIFLRVENQGKAKLLAFYRDDSEINEVKHQKLRQVEEVFQSLLKKYEETGDTKYKEDADYLYQNIESGDDIEMLKMEEVEDKDSELDEIVTKIDGQEVDKVKGIAYMDEENNTLEVREVVNVKLPKGVTLSKVMDGEPFLRPTVLISEGELVDLLKTEIDSVTGEVRLVPALKNYIEKFFK